MSAPDWIALDWGTTHLRGWAMAADGTVLDRAASDRGMGTLARDEFEDAFLALAPWVQAPVMAVACGMVGSRQGWVEAPYAAVPCAPLAGPLVTAPTRTPGLTVHVVPGLKQTAQPDVMRGEETQIAGFLALHPGWDGVLCLPGTHTKWAGISAGEVVSFRTFMTGELFSLLGTRSILRHSVGEGWDDDAFAQALSDALSRPEALAARLFGLRADGLLNGADPGAARARLSGLLLGAELAAARPYWLGQRIAVIGEGGLARLYARALAAQGAPAETAEVEDVTLAGLAAARALILETET